MTMLNIIFLVTCYPIIFLMYFLLRNARDRNSWCFGATLSKEWKKDSAVEAIDVEYRKNLKNTMLVFAILPLVTFFMEHVSIAFTFWMIWILVICFFPLYWYAKANKQIRVLKSKRGWNLASEFTYTDLKIAALPRKVKFVTFLPCLVLSLLPIGLSFVLFQEPGYSAFRICVVTFGLCTILFFLSAIWTDRQRVSVICEDTDTNMNYARAKKQVWKEFWLICGWINTAFTWSILLAMYFREQGLTWVIIGSVLYCVAVMFMSIWLMKKLFAINRKYEDKRIMKDAADDDNNWIWGIMYYNPRDTHIMVENRMGTGTAMNMATGMGKGMYIFATLCLLIIPVSCIWMIMLDFTPMNTKVVDNEIVCTHLRVEYEIPLEDIEEYTVITDMPHVTKVAGTGMDNIHSGTFEIYREGMFEAFYNPQNDLFIKIVTEDETYYISGVDDIATQEIIDEIEAYIE